MKIYYEIKLSSPDVFDQTKNSNDGKRFEAVTQTDAVNHQSFVRVTGHLYNFSAGLSDCDRNSRRRKSFSDRLQSRQTQHHVTELTEIDNQNVARIKHS
jgi:hypothetical protein